MKTVIDAVNEFKGEWPYGAFNTIIFGKHRQGWSDFYKDNSTTLANDNWYTICTDEQFADKVYIMMLNYGDCSELEFSNYASASKLLLTKDLDKELDVSILTLGKQYEFSDDKVNWEIGRLETVSTSTPLTYQSKDFNKYEWYTFIREVVAKPQPTPVYTQEMADDGVLPSVGMECQTPTGVVTIAYKGNKLLIAIDDEGTEFQLSNKGALHALKPLTPPITLIDGNCYSYDYFGPKKGFYNKSINRLVSLQGSSDPLGVTNIQPLTVEK